MRRFYLLKNAFRQLSSKPAAPTPKGVDLKKKLVYGGDLPNPTPRKALGRVLYDRLMEKERQDRVLQICTETRNELTTREFLKHSIGLAERLKEEGVNKGDFVALVGNNGLNMNAALTGVFLMGAIPVPITYKTSLDEFKILMQYIKPKYLGCDKKYLFSFRRALLSASEQETTKFFFLDEERDESEPGIESFKEFIDGRGKDMESFVPADVEDPEKDLALVTKALTDGAMGRAVGVTHHNLNSVIARYDAKPAEKLANLVILMVQKVMWMSGLYSLIISCCFGSKLIVMSDFDEEEFMRAIHEYKVTTTFLYSSKLWQLYKHDVRGDYDLSSCKFISAIDGSLPKALVDGMKEKTGLEIRGSYGISELTGLALESYSDVKKGSAGKLVRQLYGKVVSDQTLHSVGPNEKGEICFKGPTLTKGYINDPKSSRQLLDKDGFLLSGHYGYYDEEGDFFIIDKIHFVIKYKDFKVSPKELEGIIKSLETVKDAAVSGIPHPTDGYYPIAFVVLQKGQKATTEDIMRHVNDKVPDYKRLRGGVIFLQKIPRSRESGAIKRNLLKKILSRYIIKSEVNLEPPLPTVVESSKAE